MLKVTDYGAVADWAGDEATATDNRAAFQMAIDAATASGEALHVPAGKYLIRASIIGMSDIRLTVSGKLRIIGEGKNDTLLKFGPNEITTAPSLNTGKGVFVADGGEVTFERLHLEGPAHLKNNQVYMMLYHAPGAGAIRLRDCRTSRGSLTIKMDGGPAVLECERCEMRAGASTMLCSSSYGGGGKVYLRQCTFRTDRDHCIYVTIGVSLLVEGCTFEKSGLGGNFYGISYYGDVGTPSFAIVRNTVFLDGVQNHAVTNQGYLTTFENCEFHVRSGGENFGVRVDAGGALFTGCRFFGSGGAQILDFAPGAAVNCVGCQFDGAPGIANVYRAYTHPAPWRFWRCTFKNSLIDNSRHCVRANGSANFDFLGCSFLQAPKGSDSHHILFPSGTLSLRDCLIQGNGSVWVTGGGDRPAEIVLESNRFTSTDGGDGLLVQNLGGNPITVHGGGNWFGGATGGPNVSGSKVGGDLHPRTGVGLMLPSGNTLTLSPNYDTYNVTGVATIENLQIKGENNPTAIFFGPFRLIANGPWRTSRAGNIRPKKDTPRSAWEVVTLVYNSSAGLWQEL